MKLLRRKDLDRKSAWFYFIFPAVEWSSKDVFFIYWVGKVWHEERRKVSR